MSEMEASSSSVDTEQQQQQPDMGVEKADEFAEPDLKRRKLPQKGCDEALGEKKDKLEERLGGILCCAVCLDLPRAAVYQVRALICN